MRKFDYGFIKDGISTELFGLASVISNHKTKEGLRKLQYRDTFEVLKKKAIVESVKCCNAIEGIVASDDKIAVLFKRMY